MEKKDIVQAIQELARIEGRPPGIKVFSKRTGIKRSDWYGKHWVRWGDALADAGFSANSLQPAAKKEDILRAYVDLAVKTGRLPVDGEVRMVSRNDANFPSMDTITKHLGYKNERLKSCAEFARGNGYPPHVVDLFENEIVDDTPVEPVAIEETPNGFVYLLKSGKFYKIGKTNSLDRRQYEIGLQLPEAVQPIHSIETDDPSGIEAYWHNRFKEKRMNGEWFQLDAVDIRAFRKRRFM